MSDGAQRWNEKFILLAWYNVCDWISWSTVLDLSLVWNSEPFRSLRLMLKAWCVVSNSGIFLVNSCSHTERFCIILGLLIVFSALPYLQSERIWRRGAAWSSLGSRELSRERLVSFLQTSHTRMNIWAQIQIIMRVIKSVVTYLIAVVLVEVQLSFNIKQPDELTSNTRTWC